MIDLFFWPKLLPQKFRLDRFYLVFHRVHVPAQPPFSLSLWTLTGAFPKFKLPSELAKLVRPPETLTQPLILFFKECVKGCQIYY